MFQLQLYQLKIMKNCMNNYNLVLKEQLTGINIKQKNQEEDKINNQVLSFQGVNRLLVLPFENETQRTSYKRLNFAIKEI